MFPLSLPVREVQYVVLQNIATMSIQRKVRLETWLLSSVSAAGQIMGCVCYLLLFY